MCSQYHRLFSTFYILLHERKLVNKARHALGGLISTIRAAIREPLPAVPNPLLDHGGADLAGGEGLEGWAGRDAAAEVGMVGRHDGVQITGVGEAGRAEGVYPIQEVLRIGAVAADPDRVPEFVRDDDLGVRGRQCAATVDVQRDFDHRRQHLAAAGVVGICRQSLDVVAVCVAVGEMALWNKRYSDILSGGDHRSERRLVGLVPLVRRVNIEGQVRWIKRAPVRGKVELDPDRQVVPVEQAGVERQDVVGSEEPGVYPTAGRTASSATAGEYDDNYKR
jgi:hypothetical protein